MDVLVIYLGQLHREDLHVLLCELSKKEDFLPVVEVLFHLLLVEVFYAKEDGIVQLFYHEGISCVFPSC